MKIVQEICDDYDCVVLVILLTTSHTVHLDEIILWNVI